MVESSIETDVDSVVLPCPPTPNTTPDIVEDVKLEIPDTIPEVVEEPVANNEPEQIAPPPSRTPSKSEEVTAEILLQVSGELKSFLAGGKLTLANITGVVIDLYNFIQSYKSLTHSQKIRMLVKVLTDFVRSEVDGDQTLLVVIDTLVPRIVETLVGVSDGTINIGEVVEEVEEKAKGCLSCLKGLFKH